MWRMHLSSTDWLNDCFIKRQKCPLGWEGGSFVAPKTPKCTVTIWGYKHANGGSQGFVTTFVSSTIQSWKKKHMYTSEQPLIIIPALTEVLTHDNTKCWAPARIDTRDQPSLFGSWSKHGVSKGLHSPNCTSLVLSFTISYWMAEQEIKSCVTFEDVRWRCKNLSDSQQRNSQTYCNL